MNKSGFALFILMQFFHQWGVSQKITIYFIPGQGSDHRIFDSLRIDTSFQIKFLEYGTPPKKATLKEFALQIAKSIDTSRRFILVGVSLGGMICAELNEVLSPEKVILISSAENRLELPSRYKFQKAVPLYAILPGCVLLAGARMLQPIVEPDRNKNKATFRRMLRSKHPVYMKRTIRMIIRWDRTANTKKNIKIHGARDHTLPLKKIIAPDHIVPSGSHMMTLTRAKEISELLNKILINTHSDQ